MWYKDAIFYELNVRAFADGNGDGHGDFIGLLQKVDYLAELGIDCVWMMPFYPSPLRDDGYDVSDYCDVAAPYGTLDDFKAALNALHERNIRVIIDLVVNHTSDQHPWFIESRSSKDNPKRHWYVWSETDRKYSEARIIFIDTESSNWTYDPPTGEYYWHRFYKEQPDLNYDNPQVQEIMLDVMRFWLDLGVDGFRVDAVPYLFEREGTNCENLPETHEYVKRMRQLIENEYPGRIMLAEANQWPWDLVPYLQDEFHMAFHFPIMPRLFMAVKKGDCTDLIHILQQTPAIPEETQWCLFLRNHDELTLEMVTEEQRQWMWEQYAPEPRMRLNLGIRRRLAPLLDNDHRKIMLLNEVMMSLPGSPIIYYGDEIGMGDNIWLRDRNGVRTPMQWNASLNAGFSSAKGTYEPVIDDPIYGYHRVNVEAQRQDPNSLWCQMKHLLDIRRRFASILGRGSFQHLETEDIAIFAYERTYQDTFLLVIANFDDTEKTVTLPSRYVDASLTNVLTDQTYLPNDTFTLEPYECVWLKV
ncbi:MAG: maltose alpha-D-glucosyltransferase [Phototrophicales bacterium]|nr:MAG: maltose alpha-D-glucosyltransferase [Phototrophicales bacterium]